MSTATKTDVTALVDELGKIKAKIATLEEREKELRESLIETGEHELEGKLFRATVAVSNYERIDYKGVVESLPHTPQLQRLVRKHTEESQRTTVKVVSR